MERTPELFADALEFTNTGAYIDIDAFDEDLDKHIAVVLQSGARLDRVTASTDAAINSPRTLLEGIRGCVRSGMPLERVLPFVTCNTAAALKLSTKGKLAVGAHADLLLLRRNDLELAHVFARGVHLFDNGNLTSREAFLASSNRTIDLHGQKQ